ncbi:hypothetical protein Patl1_30009 [Pistacia atlantica]|uniref:Uncharacterized protein n=1 Tax=Pistacia atlantica TaxID=434234 RepID=A0ACC1ABL7_9ROSI|nr:hypothetical protein Patl1_30009 [Pistacia atlantica]
MPLESSFALQNEFFSFSAVLNKIPLLNKGTSSDGSSASGLKDGEKVPSSGTGIMQGTGSTTANALSSGAMPSSSNLQAAAAASVKPPASFFGLTPMQSIMNRDPELEASFSFGGQDFSPALAAFSDEEDGNDDQYIEIALERPMNGDHPDDGSNQLEFCISFSSSVPFLQLPNCGLARADTVDSIGSVDSSVPFLPICGLARANTVDSIATIDSIGTEFSDVVTTPLSTSSSSTSASTLGFSSTDTRRRSRNEKVSLHIKFGASEAVPHVVATIHSMNAAHPTLNAAQGEQNL